MGRFIIKLKDLYFEWSTIVDAPVTYGMTLDELREYIKEEYGNEGLEQLPQRLERVKQHGTSEYLCKSVEDICTVNHAGENEECISLEQIYELYAKPPENSS